ncbi:uncharacterized protein C5L36_0C00340 [Pichia kudriavzevii]|uniref:Condensin complex subunit 1 n=1 Tax=Pichia kudriavzevii TaxID=4909 RepID=A0A2U9R419_PICKU|nr:uncharacterized protein C5L36_0C00340 [Pichia kudriavzevii]AWU76090.1 hypothetical protein C5L36_0C00340 [Pichia kudriavzevii]
MDFDLAYEVSTFSTEKRPDDGFNLAPYLNRVSDKLASSPSNILNDDIFEMARQLVYYIPECTDLNRSETIFLTFTKAFQCGIDSLETVEADADASDQKELLCRYVYLLFGLSQHLVTMFGESDVNKKRKKNDVDKKRLTKLNLVLSSILATICDLLNLQLSVIIQSSTSTNDFCDVILKLAYSIMMSTETLKEKNNRSIFVKLFCLIAKNHQQNNQVCHRLTLALPFSEHLSDTIAEILSVSYSAYENQNLVQDVLTSLAEIQNVGPNLAKNIGSILVKLSELLGQECVTFLDYFQNFVTATPTVRAATMMCFGNSVNSLSTSQELVTENIEVIESLISTLEEHLLDNFQIVRQRCFQALELIHSNRQSKLNFKEYRYTWALRALNHLEDKSSFVRKAALNLLKCIIVNHPYTVDQGKLSWKFHWEHYAEATKEIKNIDNGIIYNAIRANELENNQLNELIKENEDDTQYKDVFKTVLGAIPPADHNPLDNLPSEVVELILRRKFLRDACIFIKILDKSFEFVADNFLNSKTKSDVIAAIEYFTIGDAYGIETAKIGVKRMLHLIWTTGSNEDGNRVVEKLIDAYVTMFLTPFSGETERNKTIYVASSLIKLTFNCNMADLISLEKMISELVKGKREKEKYDYNGAVEHYITPQVVSALWSSFVNYKHFKERRGAIIILSMLAASDYRIVHDKIDVLLKYGLDTKNLNYEVATYTCIALRRSLPRKIEDDFVYPNFAKAISKCKEILLTNTIDGEWYNLAEETLTTLYDIDIDADQTSSLILKQKAVDVFGSATDQTIDKSVALSQFLFLLGHVGLKTIIYLEKCEADFKRKKQDHENKKNEQDIELEMIGGTNEDEFSDAIQNIKDKELLYGPNSILAKFVPLVVEIIQKPKVYSHTMLKRQATLCFAKFMCISPRFCEAHLGLYLNLMKKSTDPIVRSNLVLGLGDIAVCFTNIIDENRNALYSELHDKEISVQRTCLMTVTFLILAGQIKVKGQLSQLAKLLVHEDEGLRQMAKMFFQELATKDNAIYNGFIEMLSGLNQYIDKPGMTDEEQPFPLAKFKEVIRFVLPFISKDRQRNLLIKKLDVRLKTCTKMEYQRYAFCLRELIKREDGVNRKEKDSESEKAKYYKEILKKLDEFEESNSASGELLKPVTRGPKRVSVDDRKQHSEGEENDAKEVEDWLSGSEITDGANNGEVRGPLDGQIREQSSPDVASDVEMIDQDLE